MPAKKCKESFLMTVAVFSVVLLELFCAHLAFETLGAITSSFYFLVVAINIVPVILLFTNKQRTLAVFILSFIGLLIVPYQLYLGDKLISLKEEAANLTAYLYNQEQIDGTYPEDLSAYEFSFPELKNHFTYNKSTSEQFELYYFVGTENTSHYYKSGDNKWGYYPD